MHPAIVIAIPDFELAAADMTFVAAGVVLGLQWSRSGQLYAVEKRDEF